MGRHDDPLYDDDDLLHDENYCRHGNFIGNPYGADYMCGWCESGEEPPTQAELDRRRVREAEKNYDTLVHALSAVDVDRDRQWSLRNITVAMCGGWSRMWEVDRSSNLAHEAWTRLEAS